MKNPYEVLGVEKDASAQDISSAYRKKALLHHPDRNPGDRLAEQKFREATEAYSVLSDPEKRLAHDVKAAEQDGPFGGFPGPGSQDFFNNMWGVNFDNRNPFNRAHHAGKDVEKEIELTVEESVLGTARIISTISGEHTACGRCRGQRSEPGTRKIPCTHCAGSGKAFFRAPTGIPHRQKCRPCDGHGDVPVRKCTACEGHGTIKSQREFTLKVPAGISDGQKLRLAGQGEAGDGGPPGDMYVTVKVIEGGRFSRKGNDLHTVVRVPFHVAMGHHGAAKPSFTIQGIDSKKYRIDLSSGFRPGETQFVIRGAGVGGISGTSRGNMHVVLHVEMPEAKTPRAAALIRELVDELSGPPSPVWSPPSPDD